MPNASAGRDAATRPAASATVGYDGIAIVQSGTQDLGTATWTVMAQVAADALGFPLDKVRFDLGVSRYAPAPGPGGSQSAASVSPAVQAACLEARGQLMLLLTRDCAWPLVDVEVADMTIENG